MEWNELRQIWASPENRPTPELMKTFMQQALAVIAKDRSKARGMLVYVIGMTLATTVFSAWQMLSAKDEGWSAWYAHLMLAGTWVAALALARQYRLRLTSGPAAAQNSIRSTLESLNERANARYREVKTLLGLFVAFIPLLVIAIWQLQVSGKMRPHEATSAATLAGVILICGIGWFVFDLLVRKRPERQHLEALLREYRS